MQFRNEYHFLSNFYRCPVTYEGLTYQNTEAAFQAAKCIGENIGLRNEFVNLSGGEAKRKGRHVPLRADWENVKLNVMLAIVTAKFKQNPDLAKKLLATDNLELVEDNTWNDTYWGRCQGVGKNMLGTILMQVRYELQKELGNK